jgi:hypothetical protein
MPIHPSSSSSPNRCRMHIEPGTGVFLTPCGSKNHPGRFGRRDSTELAEVRRHFSCPFCVYPCNLRINPLRLRLRIVVILTSSPARASLSQLAAARTTSAGSAAATRLSSPKSGGIFVISPLCVYLCNLRINPLRRLLRILVIRTSSPARASLSHLAAARTTPAGSAAFSCDLSTLRRSV